MSNGKGDFSKAHKLSAGNEGGVSKDKKDTGNYLEVEGNDALSKTFVATRYGQTFGNWLSANGKAVPKTKKSFDKLSKEFGKVDKAGVEASFKAQYWTKYNLDDIADADVASNIYDAMINQNYTLGGGGTHETLANVLNGLGYEVDASTDFSTNEIAITALNKAIEEKGAEEVNTAYSNQREKSYMGSGTVPEHGKGWLKRLNLYREDEDQYDEADLNSMVFTNDSTSNQTVLRDLRVANDAQVAGYQATFDEDGNPIDPEEVTLDELEIEDDEEDSVEVDYSVSQDDVDTGVSSLVDWANSDNPEDVILNAVDKVNKKAKTKRELRQAEKEKKAKEREANRLTNLSQSNVNHLETHDIATPGELDQSDNDLVADFAEAQRVQWSKLGTPGIMDTVLNATGLQSKKLGVDDDFSNVAMRKQIVTAMSEGLDMNTNEGKRKLRDRLEAYTLHVKSDEYQNNLEALNPGGRDTSYQNMTDDLSFHSRILINDANEQFELEGSKAINPTGGVSANVDVEGVILDNERIVSELAETDPDLATEIATDGLDAVATRLAVAQQKAAKVGDEGTDPATLLKLDAWEKDKVIGDKSLADGVARSEAMEFADQEDDDEEEDIEGLLKESKDNLTKSAADKLLKAQEKAAAEKAETEFKDARRVKRMKTAEKVLSGLKAAAGVLSLSKALKDPDIDVPEISPLIMEAVDKQRQLAKSGLSSAEKSAAMNSLNDAYAGAMKNVLRASGGQRGMFLAGQGVVDANRIKGLNQLAATDAALHRQNIGQFNQIASSAGQMKLQRDMTVEQMRQTTMSNNRQTLAGIGSNLVSDALSDASWYLNPNRELIEKAKREALEKQIGGGGDTVDPEDYDYDFGNGDNSKGKTTAEIKAAKDEAARQKQLNKTV